MADNVTGRAAMAEPYENVPLALEEEEDSIDLIALFQVLRRGKRTILGVTLAVFVLATAIAFLLPRRFTSTVSFIPPALSNGNSMAATLAGQLSAIGGGDLFGGAKTSGDLYAGILESRSIASELVKNFHLMDVYRVKKESEAEKALASNTAVTVDQKSTIVTVNVTDKEPERARDLANAYMDALRETNGRLALSQSSQRRLFFGQQLAKEKDDLEDAEVELKKTEEQSGLIAPSGQTEAEIRSIADMQAQVAIRQVELASLRESATEQNPEVIRLRSEIDDLQGQLAHLQKGNTASSVTSIPTSKVPQLQLEYVRKEREVKYHEALFDMLSRQFEAARLDEAREAPVLQVLDAASLPDTKSSPKRMFIMLGGLLVGIIVSSIWVLVREPIRTFRRSLAQGQAS
jgi:tyrosine-protein kinase Etk/Wzc